MTSGAHLGIADVAEECARIAARSIYLFEITGGWVADTVDPNQQRSFAEASHRHAWHGELWADRSPSIPTVDHDELVAERRQSAAPLDQDDRVVHYLKWLDELISRLDHLEARTDPDLDPSTVRAVRLTRADLTDLRGRSSS